LRNVADESAENSASATTLLLWGQRRTGRVLTFLNLAEGAQPLHNPDITSFRTSASWAEYLLEGNSLSSKKLFDTFVDLINVKKDVGATGITSHEAKTSL